MQDSGVDSDQGGEWLSLRAAADRLGISEKTARRRVKRGDLQGRQVSTQHGQAWEVWVAQRVPTAGRVDAEGTPPVQGPELLEALRLIERQQQTIMELSGRVGYLQAELGQARERILALEAPKVDQVTANDAEAVSEAPERPWWRRAWGWLGA